LFFEMIFLSHIAGCLFAMIAITSQEDMSEELDGSDMQFAEDSWVMRYR